MTVWELAACVEGWNKRESGGGPPEMTGSQFDELEAKTRAIVAAPKTKKRRKDDGSKTDDPG